MIATSLHVCAPKSARPLGPVATPKDTLKSDDMTEIRNTLPDGAKKLGYAGLLPQLFAVVYASGGPQNLWISQAAAFGYAALIFSFLGGAWWGIGLLAPKAPRWVFVAAVLPSLIAFACYLPWFWGVEWPMPSLVILGLGLFDPVPDLHPARMRILALHRLGLTPADEAKSAGVINPRDV
jgi:Protein of unknown function (DUF3429)